MKYNFKSTLSEMVIGVLSDIVVSVVVTDDDPCVVDVFVKYTHLSNALPSVGVGITEIVVPLGLVNVSALVVVLNEYVVP